MTVVPDTRAEFERWWDALTEEGHRLKDPYLGTLLLAEEMQTLDPRSATRELIDETLIDWLRCDDSDRWSTALALLKRHHVGRAATVMREVAATTTDPEKLRSTETFRENADAIERHFKHRDDA